ncbi:cellulose binding domain-containing protein [Cellvibrio japonicus]|uniref:Endo-1,4-beta-xylanase, putative, xyn5A n=1 Tax=Cellvibrio japonicus (strain Ueda107) TaxID=498211 RepID=B3PEH7_CELJU|nr:cellulose binding domain-containing protein [Cellvibrio japonicus]ACE83181.1 endo-1,4-beta-xylanase, putative, xyn5A [Cellvibrio japonicus Ueda107]QEI13544.1 xylanase [Cellvibrio japonicus]QEI17118.1 xylanase [Cellvibrio japonicus]QEI20695.1 xylanase [Cellvibrio japonicus]
MNNNKNKGLYKTLFLSIAGLCLACTQALAQTINVNAATEYQTIRGFGGMNGVGWINDLTTSQLETAFGSDQGQLGLSIMRMRIDPNSANWRLQVPAAVRARQLGAILLASPWSPPAHMKSNKSLINGGKLLPEYYGDYATHLLGFADHMSRNGAPLHAISLQNEPDWHPDYESCDWNGNDFVNFLNAQGSRFGADLQVAVGEAVGFTKRFTDPVLNSPTAVQHADIIAGHLYGAVPQDYPLARSKGKEVWMTEHYTDSKNDADVWPLALDVGVELHRSMAANFNAYIWWYIRRFYSFIKEDGQVSKRGYIMSQYARFVRPGFKRIGATENPYSDVMVTAYKGPDNKIVMVVVNNGNASRNLNVNLQNATVASFVKYSTSDTLNVSYGGAYRMTNGATSFWVEPKSIATFVSEGTTTSSSSSSSVRSSSSSSSSIVSSSSRSSSSVANTGANASCTYVVTNQWNNGYTASIRITNNGTTAINGWNVSWNYTDGSRISNSWNANLTGSNPYAASGLSWNSVIQPGQSVEFGFQGTKNNNAAQAPAVTGSICR